MSKQPDPARYVPSVDANYYYHCPDLISVDQHISDLHVVLAPGSSWTESRRWVARYDIDLLLLRRLYLQVVGPYEYWVA